MANSESTDLMSVGKHCSLSDCKRLDFLPYKCGPCGMIFCQEHYGVNFHNCPSFKSKDRVIPSCPLCGKLVVLTANETINDQVERHIRSGCQNLTVEKRKKNRCSQMNCKKSSLVPIGCHKCLKNFCVRHRHPGDHNCIPTTSTPVAVH